MTREWKPGDFAVINLGGGIGWAPAFKGVNTWLSGAREYLHGDVLDARPLVVIDPEDAGDLERFARAYADSALGSLNWDVRDRADREKVLHDLQVALRGFANPMPPKPDEPKGFGAMVTGDEGYPWVRIWGREPNSIHKPWTRGLAKRAWGDFDAVEVIREGL